MPRFSGRFERCDRPQVRADGMAAISTSSRLPLTVTDVMGSSIGQAPTVMAEKIQTNPTAQANHLNRSDGFGRYVNEYLGHMGIVS